MNIKLLDIELEYNSDEEDFFINIKYGNILYNTDFKDMKEDIYELKEKIIKVIQEHIEEK